MKKILTLLAVFFTLNCTAQKVGVDDNNLITVDGKAYAKIDRDGCGFAQLCKFFVSDTSGKKQIVITLDEYNDPTEVQASNPKGRVVYFTFTFLESKQKAEVEAIGIKTIKVAKFIVKNELFKDGVISKEGVDNFVLINDTKFSARRKSMH